MLKSQGWKAVGAVTTIFVCYPSNKMGMPPYRHDVYLYLTLNNLVLFYPLSLNPKLMKSIITSLLLMISFTVSAQHYQCLNALDTTFFTNPENYLRGMRIDSVKTFSNYTAYYPFHSPRGPVSLTNPVQPDSTGASWMGKEIKAFPDGTWLFDNFLGDTLIIRTQASVGDTWNFYTDSDTIRYEAVLSSVDTMSLLGNVDSIKTITLRAKNTAGTIVATDSLNNRQIILSKTHGFVLVPDLYLFPYHRPNQPHSQNEDLFLNLILYPTQNIGLTFFRRSDFHYPKAIEVIDYNPGDLYVTRYKIYQAFNQIHQDDYVDSVLTKTVSTTATTYTIDQRYYHDHAPSIRSIKTQTILNNDYLFNNNRLLMPEEYGNTGVIHYYKEDTAQCQMSPRYAYLSNYNRGLVYPENDTYKTGIGLLDYSWFGGNSEGTEMKLMYYRKSGISCGNYLPESIGQVQALSSYASLFPNPADNAVTVSFQQFTEGSLQLIDYSGRVMMTNFLSGNTLTLSTEALPSGFYLLLVVQKEGTRFMQKVSIMHR